MSPMANTARTESLDEFGDPEAPIGSRPWAIALRYRIHSLIKDADASARFLRSAVQLMEEHQGYQSLQDEQGEPFRTFEAFCVARSPFGLGYDPSILRRIIDERESAQARAMEPKIVRDEAGRQVKGSNTTNSIEGDRGADYLTARIARDRPDILERMKIGEYTSVRSAALEAGIVKPRVSVATNPESFARAALKYLDEDQVERLIELLGEA